MKSKLKLMLPLAAFVFAANFGYAQTEKSNSTDSVTIPVTRIPEPSIYVGDANIYEGVNRTKEQVLEQPFLTAKDLIGAAEWTVLSYTVTFVVNGKEEAPIRVTGSQFSDEVKSRIQSATTGTVIEFSEIRIQSTVAGTRHVVSPMVIRIK